MIGGSSSINGMVYGQGHARDLIHGQKWGHGWSYADVLPYYLRQESWTSAGTAVIPNGVENGPLHVTK